MQIREQGKKIQLLRSVYNPALKKCKQVLVGSISKYGDKQLDVEVLAKLTEDEVQQFNKWVADEKLKALKHHNWYELRYAEANIVTIANAVTSADNIDQLKIDSLKSAIKDMLKVLRKAEKKLKSPLLIT